MTDLTPLESDLLTYIRAEGPCDAEELWDDVFCDRLEGDYVYFWELSDKLIAAGLIRGWSESDEMDSTVYLKAI